MVRALDTETADIAALPRVMGEFLERVQFLFEPQWCRNPASEGFTAHVLRLIESGAVQVESPDQRGSRVLTVSPIDLFNAFSIFDLGEGANISDDNAAILPVIVWVKKLTRSVPQPAADDWNWSQGDWDWSSWAWSREWHGGGR